MTFDSGLHEVCVRVGGREGVLYVITKFSLMDSLPNFLTHGAPLSKSFKKMLLNRAAGTRCIDAQRSFHVNSHVT